MMMVVGNANANDDTFIDNVLIYEYLLVPFPGELMLEIVSSIKIRL